jgi:hypothetical protein
MFKIGDKVKFFDGEWLVGVVDYCFFNEVFVKWNWGDTKYINKLDIEINRIQLIEED